MKARMVSAACGIALAVGCGAATDDGPVAPPSNTEGTPAPDQNIATTTAAVAGCPSVTSTLAEHAAKGRAVVVQQPFFFFVINVYYAASQAQNESLGTDPNQRVTLYPLQYGFTADATRCYGTSLCSDGIVQQPEECDGTNFGGATCASLGYLGGGTLSCNYLCQLEKSGCLTACNNGILEPGEFCDKPGTPVEDCTKLSSDYASGTVKCSADCSSDASACVFPTCGDGVRAGYEQCDGADLGPVKSCHDFSPDVYQSGTLSCTDCHFDVSGCQKYCGNGVLDPGEQCDGTLFAAPTYAGKSCTDFEFPLPAWPIPVRVTYASGPLTCTTQCSVDMSACKPRPGCYSATIKGRTLFECH
jgi:hypothetical protein